MSYLWRILTAMRMTIKEFFSFKTNKYFWVNIIAMIVVMVVMIFGVLKWLDIHTHHGESVVVPDVKGMTVEEATKMFRNHGLVHLLQSTQLQITEISDMLGFGSSRYFTRCFKKSFGIAPSEYRKKENSAEKLSE